MIKIFEVLDLGDDGRQLTRVGFFTTRAHAERAAIGRGVMGRGDGQITEHDVCQSYEELRSEVRKRAIEKLTPAERLALGM